MGYCLFFFDSRNFGCDVSVRPYRLWGRGRGVAKQPDGGWRMPFFGRKSRGTFGQPAFFLAGNRMTTVAFVEQNDSVRQKWSLELEKKYQVTINGKKEFNRVLSCLFRKSKSSSYSSRLHLCCRFRAANWVCTTLEFAVFRGGPDLKYRAGAFFLSISMVFAAVRTHFPRTNTRVCRN